MVLKFGFILLVLSLSRADYEEIKDKGPFIREGTTTEAAPPTTPDAVETTTEESPDTTTTDPLFQTTTQPLITTDFPVQMSLAISVKLSH